VGQLLLLLAKIFLKRAMKAQEGFQRDWTRWRNVKKKILQLLLSDYQQRISERGISTGIISDSFIGGVDHTHGQYSNELIEHYLEKEIERKLSDPQFINDTQLQEVLVSQLIEQVESSEQTDVERIIREETQTELEQLLSDEEFIQNGTDIFGILHEQYDLTTDTISNLTDFRDVVTEFHEKDIELKEQRRLVESSAVVIIGVAVLLLAAGTRSMTIDATSVILGNLLTLLLGISGIGLVAAGIIGLNKNLTSDV